MRRRFGAGPDCHELEDSMRASHACPPIVLLFCSTLSLQPSPVWADTDATSSTHVGSADEVDETWASPWSFSAGAAVFAAPDYPGASKLRVLPAPLFGIEYGRFFVGSVPDSDAPLGIGADLYRDRHWRVGIAFSYDFLPPRQVSDDPAHLKGLGDVPRTAHAQLFANYTLGWFAPHLAVSQDIADRHQGTTATLDLSARYMPLAGLTLTAGPGLTWATGQYTQTFFGVDAIQSLRSGIPVYVPGAGITSERFSVGTSYVVNRHWQVGSNLVLSHLPGRIGDSPIVEKKDPISYGAFVNYAF
jgi:MipA family protein